MADTRTYPHSELTGGIIAAFYHVYNHLGYGFLEKVYENALVYELGKRGYKVGQQIPITTWYDGVRVGDYYADIVVNQVVIIEAKTAEHLDLAHEHQLLNYLRATGTEVGLLLNFGPKPEVRRKVYQPTRKGDHKS
jgi:GxxExxY protein